MKGAPVLSSVVFLFALGWGCSDNSTPSSDAGSTSDSPATNDAAGSSSGGGNATDAPPSNDATGADVAADVAIDAPPGCVPSAACPPCVAPQVCCAQRCPGGGAMTSCTDPVACSGATVTCFSSQDCAGGQICCGSNGNNASLATQCVAGMSCSASLPVCRTLSDCLPGQNGRCAMGSSNANLYGTCRAPTPDSGVEGGVLPDGGDGGPAADGGDGAAPGDGGDGG
jgi:hypothetical protein